MIEVRDASNNIRCKVEITDKCVYSKTLMEDEYVLLSFESDTLIGFQKKDSIKTDFGTFRIKDIAKPEMQSDGGYLYEQKFVPDWVFWENRICFYNRQLGSEKAWKMTQRPEYFLDIVVGNIQQAGLGSYTFEIDESLTEMKLVEFDDTNIIDALTKIAEAWETEWWIADKVIHLSKCESGSPVSLSEHDELGSVNRDDSQDTTYITRAYVFGSTRNLPKNYRKNDDGTVVVEGVVETRLKLPDGVPYIDAWENMKDEDIVEGVIVLDDIYPRNVGTISTITTKKYTDKIENEDGTTTHEDWNAFRFTDTSLPHFSKDYVLAGQELRIIFQTGKLAGMDFAVTFNPDALSETDTASQVFEIVRNDTYGVNLPTDTFKPEVGDTYILYGYDTKYVYDNLVSTAEQELLTKGKEKLADASKDKSVFTCLTNPLRCAGYKPNGSGRMTHATADEIDLDMGQSVKLVSVNHFGSGYRLSRVRGFEKRLDNKYNCTYTIGESSAYSRSDDLQEQVDALTYQSRQFVNVYGNSVYVVKRYDTTAPSDTNVPSFKRAQYEFLQRNVPNRAASRIGFDDGIEFGHGGFQIDEEGKAKLARLLISDTGCGIDSTGVATLKDILSRQGVTFGDFVTGLFGRGGRIDGEGNGEMRSLRLWDFLEVPELRYNRVSIYTGVEWHTNGGGIIESVTPDVDTATGICKLKLEEGEVGAIAEGDMCMGIFHNEGGTNETATTDTRNGNFTFAGFCTVYFLIDETGYINESGAFVADEARKEAFSYILRTDDTWTQKYHPQAQMHFAQYAHATDKTRQSCRYSTTEYTIGLRNMTTWTYGTGNIYKIDGRLDGFSMDYYDFTTGQTETQQFSGYGVVFGDIWAKSIVTNSQLFNTLRMDISYAGQTTLDYGEELPVTFELCIQTTPIADLASFAGKKWVWTITRNSGDAASDAVWNANAKAQSFNANAGSSATLTIAFKEGDNDLGTASPAYSTIFTAKARLQGTEKTYEATINI